MLSFLSTTASKKLDPLHPLSFKVCSYYSSGKITRTSGIKNPYRKAQIPQESRIISTLAFCYYLPFFVERLEQHWLCA